MCVCVCVRGCVCNEKVGIGKSKDESHQRRLREPRRDIIDPKR